MASDALKEERSKLHESAINEHQLATDEGTGTDLIQCGRLDLPFVFVLLNPQE
jgi:hypothetical protein